MMTARTLALPFLAVSVLAVSATDVVGQSDPRVLTSAIDKHIAERWDRESVKPAEAATDEEWLRRVYLDVAGKIPPASIVRRFVADEQPDKRVRIVDDLLNSPTYVTNFTTVWRNALLPESVGDIQLRVLVPSFESWLRQKLAEDTPYDQFVHDLITARVDRANANNPQANALTPTALAFFQAKEAKPENLAASTARLFLGVRIGCAQCHHHPFDSWKQEQFWGFAAFYSGLEREGGGGVFGAIRENSKSPELKIPESETVVQAAFLDGNSPEWQAARSPRTVLADWITSPDNRWFSRMAVNRMWGHFFGRGIVDPVDDFANDNVASHPELLDDLANAFIESGFDLKYLIRAITASDAYQLTSRQSDASQAEPSLFAKMSVKGLTPEQLFDSLAEATGFYQPFQAGNPFMFQQASTPRSEFLSLFRNDSESPLDRETSILQALAMMNGEFVADATSLEQSRTLTAIVEFPLMSDADRIESLFLCALGRHPTEAERERMVAYVSKGGATEDSKAALGDVFWALLNGSEFMFNH